MKARCRECGFAAHPESFDPTPSAYHDLRCPECGTTNIDTSEMKAADPDYGYGNDNFLEALSREAKP